MNIVLFGFRGVGKTTVGRILAKKLGVDFIDTDDYFESKYGMTISEFFRIRGETFFRMLESDTIAELSKLDSKVIAVGGGAVLKYKNIKNLKRRGIIFLLEADCDTVFRRLQADICTPRQRPPLTTLDDLYLEIKEVMEFRRRYYARAADHIINTVQKNIDGVMQEIFDVMRESGYIPL
ncbi:MAG: shikimate kinase [Planctomycetes bacterium]|nr:shikimate kinase [Planctomycetota bacterium]MCK5579531.1 shikimate kinase [Planctomycetota bacterium]